MIKETFGLTLGRGDFERQLVVVISDESHVSKHSPVVADMSSVSKIALRPADHTGVELPRPSC